jgi:hypothetical protein
MELDLGHASSIGCGREDGLVLGCVTILEDRNEASLAARGTVLDRLIDKRTLLEIVGEGSGDRVEEVDAVLAHGELEFVGVKGVLLEVLAFGGVESVLVMNLKEDNVVRKLQGELSRGCKVEVVGGRDASGLGLSRGKDEGIFLGEVVEDVLNDATHVLGGALGLDGELGGSRSKNKTGQLGGGCCLCFF